MLLGNYRAQLKIGGSHISMDVPKLWIGSQAISFQWWRCEAWLCNGTVYIQASQNSQPGNHEGSAFFWKNSMPPRVQMFMWLLTQGRTMPNQSTVWKNNVPMAQCEVCEQAYENPEHIINGCSFLGEDRRYHGSRIHSNKAVQDNRLQQEFGTFIALSCWRLWKTRNALVFRNERTSTQQLWLACMREVEQWRARLSRRNVCSGSRCTIFRWRTRTLSWPMNGL